jgi:hypothetical protein
MKRRSHWCPQRIPNCEFAKGCVTPRSAVASLGVSESGEEIALNHIDAWKEHQPQFRFEWSQQPHGSLAIQPTGFFSGVQATPAFGSLTGKSLDSRSES